MSRIVNPDLEQSKQMDLGSVTAEGDVTRRSFFKYIFMGAMAGLGALGAGSFFSFFLPRKTQAFGSKVKAGKVADFPIQTKAGSTVTTVIGATARNRDGRFYMVHLEDGLIALYWKCVHLGCTVPWNPQEEFTYEGIKYVGMFHCPCHGSTYIPNGQIVAGPAPRPLDYMEITLEGDNVTVDTGKIKQRIKADPKTQATKV